MAHASNVITVLFNTKERTFLGRGGRWQSAEEFIRNPPAEGKDCVPDPSKGPDGTTKGDPGGFFQCVDGRLYFFSFNPQTGGYDMYDIAPCPW